MSFDYAKPAAAGDTGRPLRHQTAVPPLQVGAASLAFDHDFRVGEWLVQPSLDRVSRPGADIRLRPQVMNMLVCLARGRGRTVSREQILDEVWPGQSVADTSIARCVAELRKAMGDRAQAPTVLETIPKRGYRLIAPVSLAIDIGRDGRSPAVGSEMTHRGPGHAPLPVVAGATAGLVSGSHPAIEGALRGTFGPAEPGQPDAPARPTPGVVAVSETGRRRTAGLVWLAGLVAAVTAVLWPSASR